jgi:hypothetical protein
MKVNQHANMRLTRSSMLGGISASSSLIAKTKRDTKVAKPRSTSCSRDV